MKSSQGGSTKQPLCSQNISPHVLRDIGILLCVLALTALAAWAFLYILLTRRQERRRARGRGGY
jgi:hypothetical protein